MAKCRMMLYFGSFNPIHRGHISLSEYVIEMGLCDQVALIISPQNPFKANWQLLPEMERYTMTEIACRNSRFPEQIRPSVIEFLLEKPSYTINTLHHLSENYGSQMEFSILMGSDLINQLPRWHKAEEIIEGYDLYIYPRPNEPMEFSTKRTTFLEGAPQFDISSSKVRQRIENGESTEDLIDAEVADHIRQNGLWSLARKVAALTAAISQSEDDAELYIERGKCYFRQNEWGSAINDFKRAEQLSPQSQAKQYLEMAEEILQFRYKDIYNP